MGRVSKKNLARKVLRGIEGNPISVKINAQETINGSIKYGSSYKGRCFTEQDRRNQIFCDRHSSVGHHFVEDTRFPRKNYFMPLSSVRPTSENNINVLLIDNRDYKNPKEIKGKIILQ